MFTSRYEFQGSTALPDFTGLRIMMMPVILGDPASLPTTLRGWVQTVCELFGYIDTCPRWREGVSHAGEVGYLTIDERIHGGGETTRRKGRHVDGVFEGRSGAWGGGGGWGSAGNGMLAVSSHEGCRAWRGQIDGTPGPDGECEHIAPPDDGEVFAPGAVYWLDGLCMHESLPQPAGTPRQFCRLSLPSNGPWFEGYTPNPLGVKPSHDTLPRREYM